MKDPFTRLAFCHIPKTAGTALRAQLEGLFSPAHISTGYFIEDLVNDFNLKTQIK